MSTNVMGKFFSNATRPVVIAAAGLLATFMYAILAIQLIPLPQHAVDTENFRHWTSALFAYGASPLDLSVMSPFQGMGGLMQPLGVWLNPAYLLPHILPAYDPRMWTLLIAISLMITATFLLGRGMGLPVGLAVVGAQIVSMFSFHPLYNWTFETTHLNEVFLFNLVAGTAVPASLEMILLATFCYLGRLSVVGNIACIILMPLIFVYGVLCDPLYIMLFIVPIPLIMAGVFLGSGTKKVFLWRSAGTVIFLTVCLGLNLHGFYRGLTGYAARAVFPNELYVEIQKWDLYTGLIFQGGLITPIMIAMMLACVFTLCYGDSQARGFVASVLLFAVGMIAVSCFYVYGGTHWNLPLPAYFETGVHPAYMTSGLLGLWYLSRNAWEFVSARFPLFAEKMRAPGVQLTVVYGVVFLLPALGVVGVLIKHPSGFSANTAQKQSVSEPRGVVKFLKESIGIAGNGNFRGSVVNIVGVPGGDVVKQPEFTPFNKEHIEFLGWYLRSFDPNYYMSGFWELGIPTLEDNNHLVTPPFHFLVSRAFSRPQDYHSRNLALITKANPKLMAAMGARYILADRLLASPLLTYKTSQTNSEGARVGVFEISDPNMGNYSPVRTIYSKDAVQTLAIMNSDSFSFRETAIVHDELLPALSPAKYGVLNYERGGVRVRSESDGLSLLVLPVQFSNSLRIISSEPGSSPQVKLIRVNLLETGVLFSGALNIKMAHIFGPFRGVKGRLQDIEDCRKLGIRETGEIPYPPYYQPLAGKWPIFH